MAWSLRMHYSACHARPVARCQCYYKSPGKQTNKNSLLCEPWYLIGWVTNAAVCPLIASHNALRIPPFLWGPLAYFSLFLTSLSSRLLSGILLLFPSDSSFFHLPSFIHIPSYHSFLRSLGFFFLLYHSTGLRAHTRQSQTVAVNRKSGWREEAMML